MPTVAPPDVPPGTPFALADYLRRLRTWAYTEIDKKIPKDEAAPHLLLSPSDQKTPTATFMLTVDSAGVTHVTSVPLGGGKP
jgi:hypothetical protein